MQCANLFQNLEKLKTMVNKIIHKFEYIQSQITNKRNDKKFIYLELYGVIADLDNLKKKLIDISSNVDEFKLNKKDILLETNIYYQYYQKQEDIILNQLVILKKKKNYFVGQLDIKKPSVIEYDENFDKYLVLLKNLNDINIENPFDESEFISSGELEERIQELLYLCNQAGIRSLENFY